MLSMKATYGLRAVLHLAGEFGRGPVVISDLATKGHIPRKFLEQILLELKNGGVLNSKLGKGGGYWLGRSPQRITLGEVIRVLDGPITPVPCGSHSEAARCDGCTDGSTCAIRMVMTDVRDAVSTILDHTSLADAIEKSNTAALQLADTFTYQI